MPDIHLNKVIDGQCKFEVYNIDVRTLIVWYLVYLSGSFLDWLEQEDIKVQLYKVEEKASTNLFCERSTCARVWYYYVYCYKYYILCVVPWEVNLCEGLLLLCVLLCVLTTLYYYEMLTCASIRYDLKSVYYTCDTVILLGSNCVWLVYDLKLSVYYTVIGWVVLATLFLTSSVRGQQLMTVVRVIPGQVPCMTWKSEPLVVEFIQRAIYVKVIPCQILQSAWKSGLGNLTTDKKTCSNLHLSCR